MAWKWGMARPSAAHYRDASATVPFHSMMRYLDRTISAGTFHRFFASLSIICLFLNTALNRWPAPVAVLDVRDHAVGFSPIPAVPADVSGRVPNEAAAGEVGLASNAACDALVDLNFKPVCRVLDDHAESSHRSFPTATSSPPIPQ